MGNTRTIQAGNASRSGTVNTVNIFTRVCENNVGCGNTRDGKLGRIDLDQYVKAVKIGHARYVDPKVDNCVMSNQSMAGGRNKYRRGPGGVSREDGWKGERR